MKLKNLSFNKRKIASLLLATGLLLCKGGKGEIFSYNRETTLTDGQQATVFFNYGLNEEEYAYVSFGNSVGYVQNKFINYDNLSINNDFIEVNQDYTIETDSVNIYQYPDFNKGYIGTLYKNNTVHVTAKNSDGWCIINANNMTGFMEERVIYKEDNKILYGKIMANNINVRLSPSMKDDNIIGFCDVSDTFKIIGKEDDWYIIDYLGKTAYVKSNFVKEIYYDEGELDIKKMVYLTCDSILYSDLNYNILSYLPQYQNAFVIDEVADLYKVSIDSVIGYIKKSDAKKLTKTAVIVDLSRQILKVYKNNQEVYRTHIISGRKSLQTHMGIFKIGHKVKGYQLTSDNYVDYWMEFDGNIGLHDASWQKDKYYNEVAKAAYDNYQDAHAKTYPKEHGSHGCCNLRTDDAKNIYNLISVNDNVLVIGPNSLIKNKILSRNIIINNLVIDNYDDDIVYDKIKIKKMV